MRRTKLTPQLAKAISDAIEAGNYAVVVAAAAGVTKQAYYQWLSQGRDARALVEENTNEAGTLRRGFKLTARQELLLSFLEMIEVAEAKSEVQAVAHLKKLIAGAENPAAQIAYMERRFQKRWGKSGITIEAEGPQAKGLEIKLAFTPPPVVERDEAAA